MSGSLTKGVVGLGHIGGVEFEERDVIDGPADASQGLMRGGASLGKGIAKGLSGVVSTPLDGMKKGGRKGFAKGLGQGLIGAVSLTTVVRTPLHSLRSASLLAARLTLALHNSGAA